MGREAQGMESVETSDSRVEILLVSMPFGPLLMPSIGLELLVGTLEPGRARTLYLTLPYAQRIGARFYREICVDLFFQVPLIGEWIFGRALAPDAPSTRPEALLDELHRRLPPETVDALLAIRREVPDFLDQQARRLLRRRPRMVGFTSTFQQHAASLAMARRLKQLDPDLCVVFGGANCEGPMGVQTVRSFPWIDAAVSGEAEEVFPELVRRTAQGESIDDMPGVYTPENVGRLDPRHPPVAPRVRDLDALPRPDYSEFFAQWESAGLDVDGEEPTVLFESSRGCWWGERKHCTFCGLNGTSMAFRSKSADRALDELATLGQRHPDSRVRVVDNILDMRYFQDFVPALGEANLGIDVFYEIKANLSKDHLRQLRDAGIRRVQPGIESLSDAVLKLMGKGVRGLQNIQILKWCEELEMRPRWSILWGFPGEPPEDYAHMAERVPLLTHLEPPIGGARIQLHRFSPNFEQADDLGFAEVRPFPTYRFTYDLPEESLANLAYYFDYGYRENRDVEAYTRALGRQIDLWHEHAEGSMLVQVRRGDNLQIWDFRPAGRRALTVLDGLARDLYLDCDGIRSITQLAKRHKSPADTVEETLHPLLETGLMVRDGQRVLSLAIPR